MRGGSNASPSSRGAPSGRRRSPRDGPVTAGHTDNLPDSTDVATFTSCLDIAVQGAVPIETPADEIPTRSAMTTTGATSRRAPRKSKTDALAALQNRDDTPTPEPEYPAMHTVDPLPEGVIPVKPALDLSTVRTTSPRQPPPAATPRPFGLQNCPTYYPSAEEFKDPMSYISAISREAGQYGICKIVPPVGWDMPFVSDTETFRFKTRVQRLNSIEASSRAKVNYLEQLYRFHRQQGNPRIIVPTINHKPLDLWLLRKEVIKLGGYDVVTKNRQWSELGRILGHKGIPGLSTQIKNSYTRIILPYEHFCEQVRSNPSLSPAKFVAESPVRSALRVETSNGNGNGVRASSSPLSESSSPLSEPPDESERLMRARRSKEGGLLPSLNANGASDMHKPRRPSELACEVCHKKNRGEEMLLCDGCDCGFHMFCLDPPLESIPKGQWFCHTCLFGTGGDYGFDEGEEHSLSSFQARDKEFRRQWFTSHPPPQSASHLDEPAPNKFDDVVVSEYDVEEEFWRLVQSQNETVEVEYGADVHSTTHGSAMPTLETHPLNPYSKDPWNVNNIPILSQSLLRYIKSDISGMTVPWTYVGMVFSTFCWHNEDHYTFSINYMHWGETKTWYGIPGEDAEKFEEAIKQEAPDLFEAQPDLLYQLVTLMNPKRLKDANVRVYACNQRAGEFVVTFPKAYHAGFNHGFNFNEAVNFALPDWLPQGLSCVRKYRDYRKHPVFSHDELLITVTQQSDSIKTALWLLPNLKEMTDREMERRRVARSLNLGEVLEEEDRPEEQYQCAYCKMFTYLSQVVCQCTREVVCLDHAELLCQCPMSHRTLRKRFSDEALLETLAKVEERAVVPAEWREKLTKVLSESARPQLARLRAVLKEGEDISLTMQEVFVLRKCITRAEQWIASANAFLAPKPKKAPGETSGGVLELPGGTPERTLDDLYALLKEVVDLGFDCPEIKELEDLAGKAEGIRKDARTLLDQVATDGREVRVQDCESFLDAHSTFNVHLPEFDDVMKVIAAQRLAKDLEDCMSDAAPLPQVQELLARADACDFPDDNPHIVILRRREQRGKRWMEHATQLLNRPKTVEELDACIRVDISGTAIDPRMLERLKSTRTRADDLANQAKLWMNSEIVHGNRPRVADVSRLVTKAEEEFTLNATSLSAIVDAKRTADYAKELESRCESVLKGRFHHSEGTDFFDMLRDWSKYATEHLAMFTLPQHEKLESLLKAHFLWVEKLPWWCAQHKEPHGKQVLDDVVESTRPEDDLPPSDEFYTCICLKPVRPPQPGVQSDAVQCDHCYARFHGECAATGRSCPFCDQRHWNGTVKKDRAWHFCYLPSLMFSAPELTRNYSEEWKTLEIIVHRVDRLVGVIGQFLSFAKESNNQRSEYIPQVRHFMRKLYKIQFFVGPNPDISYGMDLTGLHRILAGQPAPARTIKKRRRPKFSFGQDIDKDWSDGTRCICRGRSAYLLNYPTVQCETCSRIYHAGCVFFNFDPSKPDRNLFICPLCCVRKGRPYLHAEVRVKDPEIKDKETYVDTLQMLEQFSKDILHTRLPPPYTKTLFIELVRFTPGQPDHVGPPLPPVSRQSGPAPPPVLSRAAPPPHPHHTHTHSPHQPVSHSHGSVGVPIPPASARNALPPPPWSKGFAPPLPRAPVTSSSSSGTPHLHPAGYPSQGVPPSPGSSRKRKSPPPEEAIVSKRRSAPVTPVMHHESPHLAPVIGKIHSPVVESRPRITSDPRPVIHTRTPDMRPRAAPMDEAHSPYATDPRMQPSPHYAPREVDPRHQAPPLPRGYAPAHASTSRSERADYPPPRMAHPEVEARRRSGSFNRAAPLPASSSRPPAYYSVHAPSPPSPPSPSVSPLDDDGISMSSR